MYTKKLLALSLNLLIFILGILGCVSEFAHGGLPIVRFYTFDSNFIGMISSGILSAFLIINFINDKKKPPKWAIMFKYLSAAVLSVTFLVVVFVLSPMYADLYGSLSGSYFAMLLKGDMLYQHFLCPVLAIISVLFTDPSIGPETPLLGKKNSPAAAALIGVCPTVIYAIITITLNITGYLTGPYPFLMVRSQPVWATVMWCTVIVGLAYVIAYLLAKFGRLFDKNN
ncbi:MAG: hypothetical protein J6Y89_11065 [Lachnospiraceae bacterium]|nr:hypothetical protein [Lachnospiraceae bacterium]